MAMIERAILIVMDGCGAGAAPDAELFGDTEDLSWDSPIMSKQFSERAPFKFKKFMF